MALHGIGGFATNLAVGTVEVFEDVDAKHELPSQSDLVRCSNEGVLK